MVLVHLRKVFHALHARSAYVEAALGLTGPQFWALREVARSEGGVTLGQLARRLVLHPANAGRLVERLSGRRLVRRERSATDRRVVIVRATTMGRRLAERLTVVPPQADLLAELERLEPAKIEEIEQAVAQLVLLLGAEEVEPRSLFGDTPVRGLPVMGKP
jgi:DNA-binding MarR family transcriptional regulator